MSQNHSLVLEVPAAVAAGTPIDISAYEHKTVYVDGTFVATVQIQISPDASGSRWFNEGAPIATTGTSFHINKAAKRLRANTTAYTSGAPQGTCMGLYSSGV